MTIISADIAIKGVLGALVAILLHFAVNSRHYYLAGLIPLFPTFALFAHTMFASGERVTDMQASAQFGLWSLFPYAVYLSLVCLLAFRMNVWLVLAASTAGWAAAAVAIFILWNNSERSSSAPVQAVRAPLARLPAEDGAETRHRMSSNQDANLLFLRANVPWRLSDPQDLRETITLLERAVELDSEFAQARSALAASYTLLQKACRT